MAMQYFQGLNEERLVGSGRASEASDENMARRGIVLDLCCGDGLMTRRFAQSGRFERVFGLDISRKVLEKSREAAEMERTGPEDGLLLARADAQALPFADGTIDFVWWGLGMHMVKAPELAMKELFRVLKPGGRFMAT